MSGRDTPALVAGLVTLVLGALLLLDRLGALNLHLGVLAPTFLAAVGTILLAAGLDRQDHESGSAP